MFLKDGMKKVLFGAVALMAVGLASGAQAQVASDDEVKVLERLPADTCQKERIESAGNSRPGQKLALSSAKNHWRDQVTGKYGQKYAQWDNAFLGREECFPAAMVGFKKCNISGFPCARRISEAELSVLGVSKLNSSEIKEMQRLMTSLLNPIKDKRKPKNVKADGQFGVSSQEALEYLQKNAKVENTGDSLPTTKNLEALRKATK